MSATRFVVVTDSHLCPPDTPYGWWNSRLLLPESWALWEEAVDTVRELEPDHVLMLGDLTNFADPDLAVRALERLAGAGSPVWVVPGNHDVDRTVDAVAVAVARLGSPSVRVPDVVPAALPGEVGLRLAGLSVAGSPASGHTLAAGPPSSPEEPGTGVPCVLISHYPLLPVRPTLESAGLRHPDDVGGASQLLADLLARAEPTLVLHGHLHWPCAATRGRLLQLGMPALVEWPHTVSTVTVRAAATEVAVETGLRLLRGEAGAPVTRPVARHRHWVLRNGGWRSNSSTNEGEV